MACFLRAKDIIHVEDIITILVVIAIILDALAGLGQDSAGITRRFVLEARVANAVSRREMYGQGLQRLEG